MRSGHVAQRPCGPVGAQRRSLAVEKGVRDITAQSPQSPAASSILGKETLRVSNFTRTVPVSASEKKRGDSMELHLTKAQRRILIGIGIAGYAVFSILLLRLA